MRCTHAPPVEAKIDRRRGRNEYDGEMRGSDVPVAGRREEPLEQAGKMRRCSGVPEKEGGRKMRGRRAEGDKKGLGHRKSNKRGN
ncbi:hypothetical protein E2C01_059373 [Portunus trituberculatus]|uniref:Uncharacterized protein n=1 Tax=Portunus trituberculatus TaxID=210409 RepID=A0A5B7GYY5_PORTR|nr:hypothetical protein [Portunus trituberculatus]